VLSVHSFNADGREPGRLAGSRAQSIRELKRRNQEIPHSPWAAGGIHTTASASGNLGDGR
jgi:hypothetical protein